MKCILVLMGILLLCVSSSYKHEHNIERILCNNNFKYWDAQTGYSMKFSLNHRLDEYEYVKGKRVKPDRGDVIVDHFRWSYRDSILTITTGKVIYQRYLILSLALDSIILKPYHIDFTDTIKLYKSLDQVHSIE